MDEQQTPEDETPVRREEIAAAKLGVALGFFANGSVPNADMAKTVRADIRGWKDFDDRKLSDEVEKLVRVAVPDGFGGERRDLKQTIAIWLSGVPGGDPTMAPVERVRRALEAVGRANPEAKTCQKLWSELERRAR